MPDTILFPLLVEGDAWACERDAGAFGTGFSASITFAALATKLTSGATAQGGQFLWAIPSAQTAKLPAQPYAYNVSVTDADQNRFTLERGAVEVVADITTAGAVQNKSRLRLMLEACDATLLQLLSQQTTMVQFAGQMYQFPDLDKLFAVRQSLASQVADEQLVLQGNTRGRRIVTRWVNS